MTQSLSADDIAQLFTRKGRYLRARWGRPVAPVIFGLDDGSLAIFRDALAAVLRDIRLPLVETDPEMGANMMTFFLRDWAELESLPDLSRLTGQTDLPVRLQGGSAQQYRLFRFDPDGSIRASICFVNMGGALADAHPGQLAEVLAVRALLTFAQGVPVTPAIGALLRGAYDPVLPASATDPSDALRLFARMGA